MPGGWSLFENGTLLTRAGRALELVGHSMLGEFLPSGKLIGPSVSGMSLSSRNEKYQVSFRIVIGNCGDSLAMFYSQS